LPTKTNQLIRFFKNRSDYLSPGQFALAFAVFIVGLLLSVYYFSTTKSHVKSDLSNKFNHQIHLTTTLLDLKLDQYTNLLNSGQGLFNISGASTENQWIGYFNGFNLSKDYPGIAAVAFEQYVSQANLSNYLSTVQSTVAPTYVITPSGTRNAYVPLTYVAYPNSQKIKTFGFDSLTSPTRAAAINKALVSGNPVMSGNVQLHSTHAGTNSFIIYRPIYSGPSSTIAQRKANIYGFVVVSTNNSGLFNNIISQQQSNGYAFQIFDGNSVTSSSMRKYRTGNFERLSTEETATRVIPFTYASHTWMIDAIATDGLLSGTEANSPMYTLIGGVIVSFAIAVSVWYSVAYRERKLIRKQQYEVQLAKDDLLALASHQLRTPATVVKQYLGILLQNYGGEITEQQRAILETAYESNERQLEIANQFLSAARLDSGRIRLKLDKINLNELIEQSVRDQKRIAIKKQQKIKVFLPKKIVIIKADQTYLSMIVDNLLSNASKYSKTRSSIEVRLTSADAEVKISVRDKGIGMAKNEIQSVFDKFTRLDREHSAESNGTGIGLYLVKQVVDLHKGSIEVTSAPNRGSTFTIILPKEQK
jgi:signal transduction histidine kinase